MTGDTTGPGDDGFQFSVRYRVPSHDAAWLDYSHHPASKLGLHNALLAVHDRCEILQARGEVFECGVFLVRHGRFEPLTQDGAERLFRSLPSGDVKWLDLCQCLLPLLSGGFSVPRRSMSDCSVGLQLPEQIPLFPHVHTLYDDVDEGPARHVLDTSV